MIFRVNKTTDYTVMSNIHLRDKNLSLKAKGLLSVILSLPEDWNYSLAGLVAICAESESAVKTALNELKKNGYLKIVKKMPNETPSGRIEYEYNIYEQPQEEKKQGVEKQEVENQPLEFQGVENHSQLNTNKSSTKELSTNNKKSNVRHKYGEYENVLLSDNDMEKLKTEFPTDYKERIERLSIYMASTGKSYKNHLATIRNWARRDSKTPTADVKPNGRASYDLTEFERSAAQKPIVYKRKKQ